MAPPYDVHDHGSDFVGLFPGWLHHLSRARRRKIVGIYGMDRRHLLPDIGFSCSACLCNTASGDFDAHSGFSLPVGSPQTDCALDNPGLALRFDHGSVCLFDALQVVSAKSCTRPLVDV